jgi:hypothetical protein
VLNFCSCTKAWPPGLCTPESRRAFAIRKEKPSAAGGHHFAKKNKARPRPRLRLLDAGNVAVAS